MKDELETLINYKRECELHVISVELKREELGDKFTDASIDLARGYIESYDKKIAKINKQKDVQNGKT